MKRRHLLPDLFLVAMLLGGLGASWAQAKPGGVSGRSFSSGSSRSTPSFGRSYSSGHSSPSTGHSSPPAFSPSRPPVSTNPFSRSTPPARPSTSGKSYSSGSGASSPPHVAPSPAPYSLPSRPAVPSGKSYSSGSSSASAAKTTAPPGGSSGPAYDATAAAAQRKEESRRAYTRGKEPKPNYRDTGGTTHPIDSQSPKVVVLRREMDHDHWITREARLRRYYGPYYNAPIVIYHDPFNSLFWHWLLVQDLQTQALWTYHHRYDMDDARYRDLLARNAQLQARVQEMEAKSVPRDPTYTPPGIDRDLMYTDSYVDSIVNPQPTTPYTPPYSPYGHASGHSHIRAGLLFLIKALFVLAILSVLIWLVFFKRWGVEAAAPPSAENGGQKRRDKKKGGR